MESTVAADYREIAPAPHGSPPPLYEYFGVGGETDSQAFSRWSEHLSSAYYPLTLTPADRAHFSGRIDLLRLDSLLLSRLTAAPLRYWRSVRDSARNDGQLLVTMPIRGELEMRVSARVLRCVPGQFLLEYSDRDYEITHTSSCVMQVARLPFSLLQARLKDAPRYLDRAFDCGSGVGRLLYDQFSTLMRHCGNSTGSPSPQALGLSVRHAIDLLVLTLQESDGIRRAGESNVRSWHLQRIERYMLAQLGNPSLDPQQIAEACGISVRYLHELHRDLDMSASERLKELRLQAAHEALTQAAGTLSVREIAFRCGFADQAHFSRAFRRRFGCPPSEVPGGTRPDESG